MCAGRARASEERGCATKIISRIARLAYRRPVNAADVQTLMKFYEEGRRDGGTFEAGVQFALERMLVDPDFLLRVYRDPKPLSPQPTQPCSPQPYRLSDLEFASRLSFFLWSSIPDDQLLTLAEQRKLSDPAVLEQQVKRMLADPRASEALVNDFAAQWLNLRRVAEVVVDPERYPNYDLTLMEAFKRETELFVGSTLREDRSVLELLERRLHVRQREARQALRHSRHLRQPLPARVVARQGPARRAARAGRVVVDDVVSRSHVAGASREIPAEQHLRAADRRRRRRASIPILRRSSRAGRPRRFASGLPNIARIRRARAATP